MVRSVQCLLLQPMRPIKTKLRRSREIGATFFLFSRRNRKFVNKIMILSHTTQKFGGSYWITTSIMWSVKRKKVQKIGSNPRNVNQCLKLSYARELISLTYLIKLCPCLFLMDSFPHLKKKSFSNLLFEENETSKMELRNISWGNNRNYRIRRQQGKQQI